MQTFAEWLLEQRKIRKWSRAKLAARLKSSPRAVETWERGGVIPHESNQRKIAEVLRIEEETVIAIASGQPIPEPHRMQSRRIEVSNETADAIGRLSGESGMSPGQYVETLVKLMQARMGDVMRMAVALADGVGVIPLPRRTAPLAVNQEPPARQGLSPPSVAKDAQQPGQRN